MINPINDVMVAAISRLGEIRDHKGQRYVCIAASPYTRRDGTQSTLLVWESACAECGITFVFRTPNRETFEPNRRCQAHRKPGFVASFPSTGKAGQNSERLEGAISEPGGFAPPQNGDFRRPEPHRRLR